MLRAGIASDDASDISNAPAASGGSYVPAMISVHLRAVLLMTMSKKDCGDDRESPRHCTLMVREERS
jgi:hypothetical protein